MKNRRRRFCVAEGETATGMLPGANPQRKGADRQFVTRRLTRWQAIVLTKSDGVDASCVQISLCFLTCKAKITVRPMR